ncbi:High-affinity methionine permease [Grifola frondosa]|uniref:High-affinity methionine permease n=1 Tax=Grifola frondosa TaxID=5627 RepID=A0A1C7MTE7_GRIFR|nr:High-affinity methionine permease [Grifola frondosa]
MGISWNSLLVASSRPGEQEPLLSRGTSTGGEGLSDDAFLVAESVPPVDETLTGESFDDVPHEKRQLGLTSTAFLIFNRVIGTGIFATPSVILRSSGSVGLSLVMWVLGATVAACGTAVYVELGTGLPRSGGEKNYLEFIYRRPVLLVTCMYAMYAVFIVSAVTLHFSGNLRLVGLLRAGNQHLAPSLENASRVGGVVCITFAFIVHSTHLQLGIRLQNTLGVLKLIILVGIALSGLAVLARIPGLSLENPPHNFEWSTMWEGSGRGGPNAFVTGLFTVIWSAHRYSFLDLNSYSERRSFVGYSNANYALSEVRNPVPRCSLAVGSITLVYMLVNIAYLAVVDKAEILGSGRIVAALYFGKLWGVQTERVSSAIIAMSTLANVLAVLFTHGRVVQELGREGVLPFSAFFASNKPFNTPLPGLFAQWLVTSMLVLMVPPGDAYLFMLNLCSYPLALINMFVSAGLLFLHLPYKTRLHQQYDWHPPFRAYTLVVLLFFLSNVFLVFAPLVPPSAGFKVYERLPYWLHVLVASAISFVGVVYWYLRFVWLPRRRGHYIVRDIVRQEDGVTRRVIREVKVSDDDG